VEGPAALQGSITTVLVCTQHKFYAKVPVVLRDSTALVNNMQAACGASEFCLTVCLASLLQPCYDTLARLHQARF
jgi:hypothetical protein